MAESRVAVLAALFGNLLIALGKLAGGMISGSSAMFAEAAHSFSDVGNQILLLFGIRNADAPPSAKHPFGRGKAAFFWPLLVAVMLFGVAGGFSLYEGIEKVRHPHPVSDVRLSLAILAVAFVIEAIALTIAIRQVRRKRRLTSFLRDPRDATLLTVIVEDSLALIGLPIAAAAIGLTVWTGNGVWDGIGSILIGVLLMGFALFLGRSVHDLILGRGLHAEDLAKVRRLLDDHPDVMEVRQVQSMYIGSDKAFLGADVVLRHGLEAAQVGTVVDALEVQMRGAVPILRFIYLEPQ